MKRQDTCFFLSYNYTNAFLEGPVYMYHLLLEKLKWRYGRKKIYNQVAFMKQSVGHRDDLIQRKNLM